MAPLCLLALLATFTALYLVDRKAYFDLLSGYGVPAFRYPFLDWDSVANEVRCWRAGVDVFAKDPCDPLGRLFNYSPLWLRMGFIPAGGAWRNVIGLGLDVTFIASLYFLFSPRTRAEAGVFTLASISTSVIYLLERANIDIIVFVLFALAIAVGSARRRWVPYALIFVGGLIKLYPFAALVLVLRERRWLAPAALSAGGILTFYLAFRGEFGRIARNIPATLFATDSFGASNLPGLISDGQAGALWLAALAILVVAAVAAATARAGRRGLATALSQTDERPRVALILGSAIVVFCFFAGQNIAYRGALLLLVIAGLADLRRASADRALAGACRWLMVIAIALMWDGAFRALLAAAPMRIRTLYLLTREALWWYLITSLLAVLMAFAAASPIGGAVRARLPKLGPAVG